VHEQKKGQGGEREKHERYVLTSFTDGFHGDTRHSLHMHASQRERARRLSGENAGQVFAEGIVNDRHADKERSEASEAENSLSKSMTDDRGHVWWQKEQSVFHTTDSAAL
jgi:4-aminobutyrate aminotransferase-like enzyme